MTNTGLQIPQRLAENQARFNGDAGRRWIEQLPEVAREVTQRWGLRLGPPFAMGFTDYAAPVRRAGGSTAVLKLCFVDEEFRSQEAALRAFDGRASVRLLDADLTHGALLLERLEPGEPLSTLNDETEEMHAAAAVMRRLWQAPARDASFLRFDEWIEHSISPGALPATKRSMPWIDRSLRHAAELAQDASEDILLHGDLHFDNILSSSRGWLAIDPKGIVGDPAWEIAPLLFNNIEAAGGDWPAVIRRRIDQLCEELPLDREHAYAISAVRCLQARFWSLRDESDPVYDFIQRALYCAEELAKGP